MTKEPLKQALTCPFYGECLYLDKFGDEPLPCKKGQYARCEYYAFEILRMNLAVPSVCPLQDKCKCSNPYIGYEEDYRGCTHFSKWFWKQKAKK